jgi:hypothetical protein
MRCRVDLKTDPISLVVIAHNGYESKFLEKAYARSVFDVKIPALGRLKKKRKRIPRIKLKTRYQILKEQK